MEALAAVGLASNIISFVEFGFKAARQCHEIIKTGTTAEFDSIDAAAQALSAQCLDIRARLSHTQSPLHGKDEALEKLADKCLNSSDLLQDVLASIRSSKGDSDSWSMIAKRSLRAAVKQPKVKKLQQQLNDSRAALDSAVLHKFTSKYDLQAAISCEQFQGQDPKTKTTAYALANGRDTYEGILRAESHATRVHVTSETDRALSQIASEQQTQRFVDSLMFPDMDTRFETVEAAHKRTFDWIFEPSDDASSVWSDFPSWLSSDSTFYWISGVAGSGKSTLMSHICNDDRTSGFLQKWQGDGQLVTPHFFFWRPGSALQHSCCGMLRSLAYQVLSGFPAIRRHVATVHLPPSGQDFVPAWNETNLAKLVRLIFSQDKVPLRVCLFLDGADELEDGHDNLMDVIKDICEPQNVKACVASRPLMQFRQAFKKDPQLRLQDLTREDLKQYVQDNLQRLAEDIGMSMHSFENEILGNASGIFLWVKLVVQDIKIALLEGSTASEAWVRLRRMPKELENLYDHLIGQIDSTYRDEAFRYFIMMLKIREMNMIEVLTLYIFAAQASNRDFEQLVPSSDEHATFWSSELRNAVRNAPNRILTRTRGLLQPANPDILKVLDTTRTHSDELFSLKLIVEAAATTHVEMIHRSFLDYLHTLEGNNEEFRKQKSEFDVYSTVLEAQAAMLEASHLSFVQEELNFSRSQVRSEGEKSVRSSDMFTNKARVFLDIDKLYGLANLAWTRHGAYSRVLMKTFGTIVANLRPTMRLFKNSVLARTWACGDWIGYAVLFGFVKPLEMELNSEWTESDRRSLFQSIMTPDFNDGLGSCRIEEVIRRRFYAVHCLVSSGLQVQKPFTSNDVGLRYLYPSLNILQEMTSQGLWDGRLIKPVAPPLVDALSVPLRHTSAFAMFAARLWDSILDPVILGFANRQKEALVFIEEAASTANAFLQHGADPFAPVHVRLRPSAGFASHQICATLPISQVLVIVLAATLEDDCLPSALKQLLKGTALEAPSHFHLYTHHETSLGAEYARLVSSGISVGCHEVIQSNPKLSSMWIESIKSFSDWLRQSLISEASPSLWLFGQDEQDDGMTTIIHAVQLAFGYTNSDIDRWELFLQHEDRSEALER